MKKLLKKTGNVPSKKAETAAKQNLRQYYSHLVAEQHSPTECSVMKKMFHIDAVQYGSQPYMTGEHLACD